MHPSQEIIVLGVKELMEMEKKERLLLFYQVVIKMILIRVRRLFIQEQEEEMKKANGLKIKVGIIQVMLLY